MNREPPSDERMAEVTNSRIRQGLKGIVYNEQDLPHECEHPYCEREQSPRLRKRTGVYDTLCWKHRLKRGCYSVLTTAVISSPFLLTAWVYDKRLFLITLVIATLGAFATVIEDKP